MEPDSEGKCNDALSEGVVKHQNALTDPKGAELSQKVLLLLAFLETLLLMGGKFKQLIEDWAQVLILLNNLYGLPVDGSDGCCSQLPLFNGEGHYHILGLFHVKFQAGVIKPLHGLMQTWAVVL